MKWISKQVDRVQGDSLLRYLVGGLSGSFSIKVAAAALSFLTHILLARLLEPASYGVYVYAFTWMTFLAIVGRFGFNTASVRFVSAYASGERWEELGAFRRYSYRATLWSSLAASLGLLAVALFSYGPQLGEESWTFILAAALLPLWVRLELTTSQIQGLKEIVRALLPYQIGRPVGLIAGVGLLWWWSGGSLAASGAMAVHVVAVAVALGWSVTWLKQSWPEGTTTGEAPNEMRSRWRRTASEMMLLSGFSLILLQSDIIMVGLLVDTTEAGIYTTATKVAGLLSFVLVAANSVLSPLISEFYAEDRREKMQRVVVNVTRVVFGAAVLIGIALLLIGPWILGLFGAAFRVGSPALYILLFAQLSNAFAGPAIMILNMTDAQWTSAKILGSAAAINIAANAVLIPLHGIAGAAVGTCLSTVLWNVLAAWAVYRHLGIYSLPFSPTRTSERS